MHNINLVDILKDFQVSGISDDSRKVKKGYLFVAIKGETVDGHNFINEAIKKGAICVVGEADLKIKGATYMKVADSRVALSYLAQDWYGNPSRKLKVIGVTGTDGKTTTANIIYWILKGAGCKVGLISSVSAKIGEREYDTGFHVTNPEPLPLQKFLKKMVDLKSEYAVLEVTSHGLDQKRVYGMDFEISVLTNITHEHLDYHKTFDAYLKTKAKLFVNCKVAVLNKEDSSYDAVRKLLPNSVKVIPYGLNSLVGDIREAVSARFPEKHNRANSAAAVTVAKLLKIDNNTVVRSIKSFPQVPGRMEKIPNNKGIGIYIDFAHTPNALANVLASLKNSTKGKLIAVFGCAGERDVAKRPMMAEISTRLADISVFTAEDPRSENINKIINQMKSGVRKENVNKFKEIPERGEAIFFAINKIAKNGDVVVICGKGHEKSMAYGGFEHPWSDKEVISALLQSKKDISVIVLAAGKGTRMKDPRPKVMREICGRPMLSYTLENLRRVGIADVVVVVNYRKNDVIRRFTGAVKFAVQKMPKGGTADAARAGIPFALKKSKTLLVINGDDSAFYKPETVRQVIDNHSKSGADVSFVSLIKDNPFGLGRVVRDGKGNLLRIVEEKDATDTQRKIKEVNSGLYLFNRDWFGRNISKVKKGPQGEYYLVDLIKIALDSKRKVNVFKLPGDSEWQGVNTPEQLMEAERKMEERLTYV